MNEIRDLVDNVTTSYADPVDATLPAVWSEIVDAGLTTVGISEENGGAGGEVADLVEIAFELGRGGHATPFAEAAAAGHALVGEAEPRIEALYSPIVCDEKEARAVRWGGFATHLVGADSSGLFSGAVAPSSAQRLGLGLRGEPVDLIAVDAAARRLPADTHRVNALFHALIGAQLVGAAERAFELTRAHVSTRQQFAAPLVAMPAIAANIATMNTLIITARAALERFVAAERRGAPSVDLRIAAAVLRVAAGESASRIVKLAHDSHGAIGVTAEYPLHRLSQLVWDLRDVAQTAAELAAQLGSDVVDGGEGFAWDVVTARTIEEAAHD